MTSSPTLPRPLRWLVVVLLAAHLAGGLAQQPRLLAYARALARLDVVARGALAGDERRDPQAATGQIELRHQVAAAIAGGDRRPSAVAYTWSWLVSHRAEVPPVARVFLAEPEVVPYYYASFLWAPARIEVTAEPRTIRDAATLAAAADRLPAGEAGRAVLAARGYDFELRAGRRGLELIPVPRP